MAEIKDRIKFERMTKGLNQPELAKFLNVSKQTISHWENGVRIPDTLTLSKIADIFDCSVDYLLGRADNRVGISETGIDKTISSLINKEMISLVLQDNKIIIKLTNENNRAIFMSYQYFCKKDCQLIFIEVDVLKKYWGRNNYDEYSKYANASEHELRQDYKFKYAEGGFSRGDKDPVPIAEIALLNYTTPPCIGFRNGITRTIWLIANGYKIIPFEVANITLDFLLDEGIYSFK